MLINELKTAVSKAKLTPGKITRIEIPIECTSPLQWLRAQPFAQKIYWGDRFGGEEVVGVGASDILHAKDINDVETIFESIRIKIGPSEARYFGGVHFPVSRESTEWASFGKSQFVLPFFEIRKRFDVTVFACNILGTDASEILEKAASLRFNFPSFDLPLPTVKSIEEKPPLEEWKKSIDEIQPLFQSQELGKIVLAKKTTLHFDEDLDPFSILSPLRAQDSQCFHYCFKLDNNSVFLGASPELLFERKDRFLTSEAIAGTRPRGTTEHEDKSLAKELASSEKERQEHFYVMKMIEERLTPFCEALNGVPNVSILKLSKMMHLIHHFEAKLKPGIKDSQVLKALHPTPAVGGYPVEKALALLQKYEHFDRGWYTGAVGWIGKISSQFVVAIRSGLLTKRELSLFSGAGIVVGSNAKLEWDEVSHKIQPILSLFKA